MQISPTSSQIKVCELHYKKIQNDPWDQGSFKFHPKLFPPWCKYKETHMMRCFQSEYQIVFGYLQKKYTI